MYWAIGKYMQLTGDELFAPPPLVLWRIISGPHRSKQLAQEYADWAVRKEAAIPYNSIWQLKSTRVVRAAYLKDYGLAGDAAAWGMRFTLDGENE